ncbi:MAG: OmpH family outer membrane protein [Burkholderiaceae bacterium]|nr:OmpH family outer membrane protein [Burkholderiaceae bacterium]MCD8518014.1 OmpH family outer membrane protein [Burkholderiaceae bacterium]MCD8537339.1 OmpH family outer membrane protein [Burkholderiaceae bacterium]MCD8564338.1 OmpH family outer membrane protein [Burkholderiaceae bacterium]
MRDVMTGFSFSLNLAFQSSRKLLGVAAIGAAAVLLTLPSPAALAQAAASSNTGGSDATQAAGTKIGFVNTQRILRDSQPAKTAQEKIEKEFNQRNESLQKEIAEFRKKVQQFEKDAPVLAESDRNRRQRELGNLDADLQRKQREIQEDFNRRRNEEFAVIIENANAAIVKIAEDENYDLILQDAVTVSDRVDITDKVIKALEAKK